MSEESEHERRQREAAQRMLRQAMPDLTRLMNEIARQQRPLIESIGKLYAPQYQELVASIARSIPKLDLPRIDISALTLPVVPALRLDYGSLFPDLAALNMKVLDSIAPSIKLIQDLQRDQFVESIARVRAALVASLPPNWRGDEVSIPSDLEVLLLDEGLALAWVPPQQIIVKLFGAETAGARRKVLGNRWQSITRACIAELGTIEKPDLAEHVEFALDAAETLLAGRHRSAQALSANLLDTILRQSFDSTDHRTITGRRTRLDIDDYPLRVAIVFGGIWGSYGEFWTSQGDKVPREYTRHASAHGVSRRQYSRINSLLALMHVVSLLKLLEVDLSNVDD